MKLDVKTIRALAREIAVHLLPFGATEEEIKIAAGKAEKIINDRLYASGPEF